MNLKDKNKIEENKNYNNKSVVNERTIYGPERRACKVCQTQQKRKRFCALSFHYVFLFKNNNKTTL